MRNGDTTTKIELWKNLTFIDYIDFFLEIQ